MQKVVRAIPQWADSGEPILTQIKAFVQTNLDFLVTDIPGVIDFLNKTDTPTESRIAYNTRLSSRNFFTVATVFSLLLKQMTRMIELLQRINTFNGWNRTLLSKSLVKLRNME